MTTSVHCPWHLTKHAVERCQALLGGSVGYAQAMQKLAAMATDTVASSRAPRLLPSGLTRYRGPRPERFALIVAKPRRIGQLPSLVDVCRHSTLKLQDDLGLANNQHAASK